MVKKKKKVAKRKRRSPDEIIADLQDEIRRVRSRQRASELKESPSHKAALSVLKGIDKALELATKEKATALRRALTDTRKALAAYFQKRGVELDQAPATKKKRASG